MEFPAYSFVVAGDMKGANFSFRREALEAIGGFDPELGPGTRFLLRPDSHRAYAAGWLSKARNHLDCHHLRRLYRGLRSAADYFMSHRNVVALIALVLAGLGVYAAAALGIGARTVLRPKRRKAIGQI